MRNVVDPSAAARRGTPARSYRDRRVWEAGWAVALLCAVLLLFGPWGGRTVWIRPDGASIRDAAGYDWVSLLAGVAAVAALVVGRLCRPAVVSAVAAAAVALVSFAFAAWAAGTYALAIARGEVAIGGTTAAPPGYAVFPAAGPPVVAAVALVGAAATLVVAVAWLRPDRGDR